MEPLRIEIQGNPTLYPEAAVRGRLRLSGLSREATEELLGEVLEIIPEGKYITEETLYQMLRHRLARRFRNRFDTVTKYYNLRREKPQLPPMFIAVEGASATGKSILTLELASILVTTRIIGTDTIRQLMRQQTDESRHPELFCHTYQAHEHRQAGPESLDRVVRGYLAQCNLMESEITGLVERIIKEGASGLIEGVHIIPGLDTKVSETVMEVVIDPIIEVHRQMFISKGVTEKLTTVDTESGEREHEFQAARKIQEYMLDQARESNVPIVELEDFEKATQRLVTCLYEHIEEIVGKHAIKK